MLFTWRRTSLVGDEPDRRKTTGKGYRALKTGGRKKGEYGLIEGVRVRARVALRRVCVRARAQYLSYRGSVHGLTVHESYTPRAVHVPARC